MDKEMDECKQVEERLQHLNVVLRAIRNVNQLITREKDRDRLLQGACDNLVEIRGYFSAWIALMDNSGKLLTTAESGLKEAFLPLVELIKRGELPVCGSRALKGPEVVAIEDPSDTCTVCPLVSEYAGRGSMTVRLKYSGKVYGMFSVSVRRDLVADGEEQALFKEVANDIAFALHNMELEENHKRAEERVKHLNTVLRAIHNVHQLIAKGKDLHRLIKGVCDNFIKTRGYYSAWIALFDKSGNFITAAEAGLGEKFSRLLEILERGDLMKCGREVLGRSGVLVIVNPIDVCDDCPLSKIYAGNEAMTIRLEYEDKVYGIMSVSIPKGIATNREEQLLFEGVADDIAFAMHVIESDEKEKQSQEALRESEERYRTIYDSSRDAIMILTPNKGFLSGNPAAIEMFGCQNEDHFTSLTPAALSPEYQPDEALSAEKAQKMMEIAMEKGNHFFGWKYKRVDGEEFYATVLLTMMKLHDEKVLQATVRDITERKKLEDQFRQAQKMEAIGVLAGGVAHDFNNLLTVILGNAQLALMNIIKDESFRKEIQEIEKAGKKASSLTRQLLAFSRKQIINPKILDINEVINETEKMLERMIGEDIEFLTVLEPDLRKVYTDPGQIDQVVMNLVVNARDAMPRGGNLTIETANVELDETYFQSRNTESKPGPYVMLAVTDNGIGMDDETLSRIFDPFFTTKEIGRGTGLGLSTVYGIVKQNNGYCWVYSEPGKGTTFKIYFPRVAEGVVAGKEDEKLADVISGSETVLIVEDNDALRDITKKILQKYGYRVLEAENGEKALNISETHEGPIHLLLTDVVMPGMSGSDLSEKLQSIRPETRVIYMSGYTDNAIVHHGILRQDINFIEKPFSPESLGKKVRQVLDGGN
ncbi:MAG: response regulator [Deltaproteobacteria bacterium]|nr:response regulator [Deltaproteobacteria bacterium]